MEPQHAAGEAAGEVAAELLRDGGLADAAHALHRGADGHVLPGQQPAGQAAERGGAAREGVGRRRGREAGAGRGRVRCGRVLPEVRRGLAGPRFFERGPQRREQAVALAVVEEQLDLLALGHARGEAVVDRPEVIGAEDVQFVVVVRGHEVVTDRGASGHRQLPLRVVGIDCSTPKVECEM